MDSWAGLSTAIYTRAVLLEYLCGLTTGNVLVSHGGIPDLMLLAHDGLLSGQKEAMLHFRVALSRRPDNSAPPQLLPSRKRASHDAYMTVVRSFLLCCALSGCRSTVRKSQSYILQQGKVPVLGKREGDLSVSQGGCSQTVIRVEKGESKGYT